MKILMIIKAVLPLLVLLAGCGKTNDGSATVTEQELARHRWQLVSFAVDPIPEIVPDSLGAWMEWQGQNLRGHGGCNTFNATYSFRQDRLQITGFTATEMFCEGISHYEDWFFTALQNSRELRLQKEELQILCGDMGGLVFRPVPDESGVLPFPVEDKTQQ